MSTSFSNTGNLFQHHTKLVCAYKDRLEEALTLTIAAYSWGTKHTYLGQ